MAAKKMITVRIAEDVHTALKLMGRARGVSMTELILAAIHRELQWYYDNFLCPCSRCRMSHTPAELDAAGGKCPKCGTPVEYVKVKRPE